MLQENERQSGILLHFTSLPGPSGSGDFGPYAYRFADFLAEAGQACWQVLPVHPPSGGASPYQTTSAIAGNPLLISLEDLNARGWLTSGELYSLPMRGDEASTIDWPRVTDLRVQRLRRAFSRFTESATETMHAELDAFVAQESSWLLDFALYSALKEHFGGVPWTDFPTDLRDREPGAMASARKELREEIDFQIFLQWVFAFQFSALRDHCAKRGVKLIGDMPIFVADDSADVWAHPEYFFLREDGTPSVVAGCPPDAFSETGQRWGNALYRWDVLRAHNYDWWVERVKKSAERFDAVRLDHFIGFTRYWEIPSDDNDARNGRFLPGPGRELFDVLRAQLGHLAIIAEDLGIRTEAVAKLLEDMHFPGMKVLQFCFGADAGSQRTERPHTWPKNVVAYTGTHDNDTARGWFLDPKNSAETEIALRYMNSDGRHPSWDLVRLCWASPAMLAIAPMQDLLDLDTSARMNTPATNIGNWCWRLRDEQIPSALTARVRELTEVSARIARA